MRLAWPGVVIVLLLTLLVGLPEGASHEEHDDEHDCVVCQVAQDSADLPTAAQRAAPEVAGLVEPVVEVRRVPARRSVHLPARAPPA